MGQKIVDHIICLAENDKNERDIIIYGLEIILHNIALIIILIFLGIVTNTLLETMLFVMIHIVIQRKTGGYHTSTRFGCFLVTTIAWFGAIMTVKMQVRYEFLSFPTAICLCIGMIIITLICAPVENINKPLTEETKIINRIISIELMITFSILLSVLWSYFPVVSSTILVTLIESTIFILIGKGGKFILHKRFTEIVLTIARWSAKTSVQQSSDWFHHQTKEPEKLKEWAQKNHKTF